MVPHACRWLRPTLDVVGIWGGFQVGAAAHGVLLVPCQYQMTPPCATLDIVQDVPPSLLMAQGSASASACSMLDAQHCGCLEELVRSHAAAFAGGHACAQS